MPVVYGLSGPAMRSVKNTKIPSQRLPSFKASNHKKHVALLSPGAKRKALMETAELLEVTPTSLSQISCIEACEAFDKFHSPARARDKADTTMEMAVHQARGVPDGSDGCTLLSPKKRSKTSNTLPGISESPECLQVSDTENCTMDIQKKPCMPVPLKGAGRKLKSVKALRMKKVSTKVKKHFDRTLPNETIVPAKPKQTWKEKKKERKMHRNNYELIVLAKRIWEDLRKHDLCSEKRFDLCRELYSKVKDKMKELAVVHDSARILQCLVQYGGPDYRTLVIEELQDHVVYLTKNKYGKHVIRKILKYGTKLQKGIVISGFRGSVRKLLQHSEAAEVLDYAYNDVANVGQRLFLLEEFYGPAFTMFKSQDVCSLDDVVREQPDKKDMIMNSLKDSLTALAGKNFLTLIMVQQIFYDFFKYASAILKKDMVITLRETVMQMSISREGARVAMACVWDGTAKDRKVMLKSLRGRVVDMCKHAFGHMVLLAVFDCVDDTVLVQKVILDEVVKGLGELMESGNGRKVLTYLLVRRDQRFFCPDVSQVLEHGDGNASSKKQVSQRAHELRAYVSEPVLVYLTQSVTSLMSNSQTSLLVPIVLAHAIGNKSLAMDALASTVVASCDPNRSGDQAENVRQRVNLVEDPAGHVTLKKVIANDRDLMLLGKDALFSMALMKAAEPGTYKAWVASNRGCFILVTLFELENVLVSQTLVAQLTPLKKYLRRMTFKGAEILINKLEAASQRKMEIAL